MRTELVCGLLCLGLGSSLVAQDTVVVRGKIEPPEVLVGQRATLQLDVLGKDGWANLPTLPRIDIPGAIVYSQQQQGVRLNEQIEGESYTGQRYEIALFPQRTGELKAAPAELQVSLKTFGIDAKQSIVKRSLPELTTTAKVPPGVKQANLLCSQRITANQEWTTELKDLKVGDGIERKVVRTIQNAPAMVFADLPQSVTEGIRVYPKQPEMQGTENRGDLTGKRTDRFTYIFERPGSYEIPTIKIQWWDTEANELKTESLEGVTLEVAAASEEPMSEAESEASPTTASNYWSALAVTGLLIGVACYYRVEIIGWCRQQWQTHLVESESGVFAMFAKAASANEAAAALNALLLWHEKIGRPCDNLTNFLSTYGHGSTDYDSLLSAINQNERSGWNGSELRNSASTARRKFLAQRRKHGLADRTLPPLNPPG